MEEFVVVSRRDLPADLQANLPEHIDAMRVSRTYKMMNCGNGKDSRKQVQKELQELLNYEKKHLEYLKQTLGE